MKETILSICEKKFVLNAASQFTRLDGRKLDECRKVEIFFGKEWGSVMVSLGDTKVLAQVTCEVQQPKTTRPNEGLMFINVELSQMAAPHFEPGRGSEYGVHVNRVLERCVKDSKAVDLESLCIIAEEKVWVLRVNVNVLNHEGNLVDCASIAALAALMHFKRPDVTTDGTEITVHSIADRDPIPITLHHHPVCVSFAFLDNGEHVLSDPTALEERVSDAQLVFGVNAYRELCGLHLGGTALAKPELIMKCSIKAAVRAKEVVDIIKDALANDTVVRESGDAVGFVECLKLDTKTSFAQKRLKIQLDKFGLTEEARNIFDRSQMKMEVSEEEDKSEKSEDDEVKILPLGDNSAEMVVPVSNKKIKTKHVSSMEETIKPEISFGEGGPSTWEVDLEEISSRMQDVDSSSDDEVMLVPSSPQPERPVENIVLSGDSEEDDVLVLKDAEGQDTKKTKQNRKKKRKQNWKKTS